MSDPFALSAYCLVLVRWLDLRLQRRMHSMEFF
jgi:hypothetical protein